MRKFAEIEYLDIEENNEYEQTINKVLEECFFTEKLENTKLYISITLTNPENIRKYNKQFRNIDKETDVLSFPMFEREELDKLVRENETQLLQDVMGDIIISIERVEEQAKEYGHGFEREFAYMLVHGFYHLRGYDHITDEQRKEMREREENVLSQLNITR